MKIRQFIIIAAGCMFITNVQARKITFPPTLEACQKYHWNLTGPKRDADADWADEDTFCGRLWREIHHCYEGNHLNDVVCGGDGK